MSGRSHPGQRVVASLSMPTDVVVAAPQPAMLGSVADAAPASGSVKEPARVATLSSSAPQLASALAATEEATAFCTQYAYTKQSEVDRARSQLAAQTAAMLEQQRRYTQLNNVILGLDRERHAVQAETEAVYKEVAGLVSSNRTLKVRVSVRCRAHTGTKCPPAPVNRGQRQLAWPAPIMG
jgi:chromosome segregation ATPase